MKLVLVVLMSLFIAGCASDGDKSGDRGGEQENSESR